MKPFKKNAANPVRISVYALILAVFWTVTVAISLLWVISQHKKGTLETARIQARYSFMKDVTYRRWNAGHGGLYAPITEETRPNPYLDLKGRDIPGPSGKTLTLINPAYMTRQVHELALEAYGIRGHITSLNPIRPENAPDSWETRALKEFERGKKEVSTVRNLEGHPHMRLMRPLLTEKGCLKCHRQQGYREGDIRGGISISVPLAPLKAVEKTHLLTMALGHGLIWLIGLAGIGFGARRLNGQITTIVRTREALRAKEEAVRQANEEWETTFNTIPDLLMILDHEHRIVKANKAMADRLGVSPGDMVGQTCYEHVHGSKSPLPSCPHSRLLMDGKEHSEEVWEERLGGYFSVTVSPLLNQKDGNPGSVHVAHDITERKRAEEALKKSQHMLMEAQRIAHMGSWDWDIEKNELSWSDEVYNIFGVAPEEFDADYEAFLSFVHPEEREQVDESVNRALLNIHPYSIDHRIARPDGTERTVHEEAEVVFNAGGKAIRMIGTVRDITDQIKEQQERENLISRLEAALKNVKQLSGLLPICASCKKIRDDKGYWNQIESYIRDHSEAKFSHSICPKCAKKLYPDLDI